MRCSEESAAVGETLPGTAPTARTWVIVENPGPWGRDAVAESDLPEAVRRVLEEATRLGVGVLLARHPDRVERAGATGLHVWVARTASGGTRLRHAVLGSLDPLTRWDPAELAAGQLPALDGAEPAPLLLVCTHSKRDVCCAVNGRELVGHLLDNVPDDARGRVWECSHIGGHRFAPVTLSLPSGTVHGRLSLDEGLEILRRQDSGRVLVERMRGRTAFPAPLQAADIAVRRAEGIDGCDDLDVLLVRDDRPVPVEVGWPVPMVPVDLEVRHRDGRAWHVTVTGTTLGAPRPESCGKESVPVHVWVAGEVTPTRPWH